MSIEEIRAAVLGLSLEQVRVGLERLDTPERRAELAARLAPFRTRVTDATMSRRVGSSV
jgi:hypothetical protein